jgi:hypothetical protein
MYRKELPALERMRLAEYRRLLVAAPASFVSGSTCVYSLDGTGQLLTGFK